VVRADDAHDGSSSFLTMVLESPEFYRVLDKSQCYGGIGEQKICPEESIASGQIPCVYQVCQ
jgi:hypothetical protein